MEVTDLDKYGIIKDMPPHRLPMGAWSDGNNVRMYDGAVEKFLGYRDAFSGISPAGTAPYYGISQLSGANVYWVYAGETSVFVTDGVSHANITRASGPYTSNLRVGWTGGVMGGVLYLNNGADTPQQWGTPGLSTLMSDLSNWPANTTCNALRSFKQFMIAMDVTKSGTRYDRMVKWSTGSSFNSVPSSWDETDATLDAGEYELADTSGSVLDGVEYRDVFILFKNDSIWGMQFVGAPFIFRFFKISTTGSIINRRCAREFPGGVFAFGVNDMIVVDGQNVTPLLDQRVRRAVYAEINPATYERSFVANNSKRTEIWACYPTTGNTYPNKALVWNWVKNTITFRDLPNISHAFSHFAGEFGSSWLAQVPWSEDAGSWDAGTLFEPRELAFVLLDPSEKKLYLADSSNNDNGALMTASIERTGMFHESINTVKMCRGVKLNMEGSGPVDVYVGEQMNPDESVDWSGPFSFDPRSDYKIDCRVTGRLLGLKIVSSTDIDWRLSGFDMDLVPQGAN